MAYYGSYKGPSCQFRAVLDFRVTSQSETQSYVQYRFYVQTTGGSFGGTTIKTNWGESDTLYSNGTYADTGWKNYGWVTYGSPVTKSGKAYYTGGSGTTYTSTVSGTYKPSTPTWTPNAVTNVSHTRDSDTKNTVSWTRNATTARPYSSLKIERSVDGGSYSEIASISGSSTSYSDTSASANHCYSYRVRPYNSAGYGSYSSGTTTTYNTPAAPTLLTVSRSGETSVDIEITNPAITATSLELQRSPDAEIWETVATLTGSPVTTATDNPGGGTFYYRARNLRDTLVSEYSPTSDAVVTICAPAAPTLVSPASGMTYPSNTEQFIFGFTHNSIDGSAQSAAEVDYSTDGGTTWTTVSLTTETQAVVNIQFSDNTTITWRARTKGVHADFGEYSETRLFYVMQAPSITVETPTEEEMVSNMPIPIALSYTDGVSSLAAVSISISDEAGNVVFKKDLGTTLETTIEITDWLPDDKTTYKIDVVARSTSILQATTTRTFYVQFVAPNAGEIDLDPDPETGYMNILTHISDGHYTESGILVGVDSVGEDAYIEGVTIYGNYLQNGEPTEEAPVEVAVIETLAIKVYGEDESAAVETAIDLQGYSLCAVPGDIMDTFTIDGEGNVTLTKRVAVIEAYADEGITTSYISSTGGLSEGATVYYALEAEETISLGTITLPDLPAPTFVVATVSNIPAEMDLTYFNGLAEASSMSIYRVSNGKRTLIANNLQSGVGVVDKYAPLNTDYTYETASFAESGAVARLTYSAFLKTPNAFFYFSDEMAKAKYNITESIKRTRPSKKRVLYADREDYVSYDSAHQGHSRSFGAALMTKDEYSAFDRLLDVGRGIYKSREGDVMHADFEVSFDLHTTSRVYYGNVSVDIQRISGGDL